MKYSLIMFVLFISTFFQSISEIKQGVGAFASYSLNSYSTEFSKLPNIPNCCPNFTSGAGSGLSAGLYYEMPVSEKLSGQLRIGYYSLGGDLSETENEYIIYNEDLYQATIRHDLFIDLATISAGIYARYKIFEGLSVLAGANLGLPIVKTFSQKEVLVQPRYYGTFENGTRTRNVVDGDIEELSTILLFAEVGLNYDIPLNKRKSFYLSPEIFYSIGLNNVIPEDQWKISSLRIGLNFRYSTSFDFATPLQPQSD